MFFILWQRGGVFGRGFHTFSKTNKRESLLKSKTIITITIRHQVQNHLLYLATKLHQTTTIPNQPTPHPHQPSPSPTLPLIQIITTDSPYPNLVTLNVDIAFTSSSTPIGIGFVLRDYSGKFIAAGTDSGHSVEPASAEVRGVITALMWAYSLGYSHINLETDCKAIPDFFC